MNDGIPHYIKEVKWDLGLPMYDAPNAVEKLSQLRKYPMPEKGEAIKDASNVLWLFKERSILLKIVVRFFTFEYPFISLYNEAKKGGGIYKKETESFISG